MSSPSTIPPSAQMFGMITGFWLSQIIGVAAKLKIADHLRAGPKSAQELATVTGAEPSALFRVLRAAASVGVFQLGADNRFSLTPLGETLASGVPGSMREMAIMQTSKGHWLPWGKLDEAVRTGQPQAVATLGCELFQHYAAAPEEAAAFSAAMGNLSALVASEVATHVDTIGLTRAVDIGGAEGTLIAALLANNPSLEGIVFDLPHVKGTTEAKLAAQGLLGRCTVVSGDFFKTVPSADLYILKQILHDWNDEQAAAILRNCAASMTPRGRVAIVEMVIPDDGAPTAAQLMDVNMLAILPGRERTQAEYSALLADSGLRFERLVATHSPFQILLGTKS
ncbi:MAG: O-demethylpuromycin-O-methyltransferase [Acidobacteria bacterium]|nr:O-demethylpuromycin-O-methyltransferase [Acidobacteriota bacterium]